jgi:3-hydroxy-9,10-secoandrosta-1,3,5(10)-triene-9,17-dione monooxygenase reductase component
MSMIDAPAIAPAAGAAPIDARGFRNALGTFTTGVTIVTTRDPTGHDVGLTVNSFNSVSLDPPLVLWSLARSSGSLPAFLGAEYFAVHILGAGQEALSNRFAQRGADKFADLAIARGRGGVPLLDGCAARFECRTAYCYKGGDHEIFVGEVLSFEHFDQSPLVFQKGGYAMAVRKPPHRPDAADATVHDASISRDGLAYLLGCAHSMLLTLMRPALRARGLADDDYFLLNVLSVGPARSLGEIAGLLALAGHRATQEQVAALVVLGLVVSDGSDGPEQRVGLTDAGRRAMLELAAVAKAAEEDALQQIDYSEAHLLKHLLKRVIRNTARDVPALWPARR